VSKCVNDEDMAKQCSNKGGVMIAA
jgi:hypothetical protein